MNQELEFRIQNSGAGSRWNAQPRGSLLTTGYWLLSPDSVVVCRLSQGLRRDRR
jgi:hypothetical protein